ncbi:MAG: hypothetical protein A3F92_06930 [Candidatus Rokubacteria bacterium RIFCSPLOWO2_12_FULL_71_22]|nr:MAG: hypothetical protein A3F92_06930 [Candidatus Rokubacteria bacterium RIFCSPLOWO2_12_FULL_71_22]
MSRHDARFRQAAWAYLTYGVIYWFTALWLQLTVFPVRGRLLLWFGVGAVIALGVPWLLLRPRRWFERWILSRRDFTRILAVLVALRAVYVARLAVSGGEALRMPSFGGGVPPGTAGAWLMAVTAAATAAMLIRAGWQDEAQRSEEDEQA